MISRRRAKGRVSFQASGRYYCINFRASVVKDVCRVPLQQFPGQERQLYLWDRIWKSGYRISPTLRILSSDQVRRLTDDEQKKAGITPNTCVLYARVSSAACRLAYDGKQLSITCKMQREIARNLPITTNVRNLSTCCLARSETWLLILPPSISGCQVGEYSAYHRFTAQAPINH